MEGDVVDGRKNALRTGGGTMDRRRPCRRKDVLWLEALRTELGRMIAACEQDTVGDCRIIDALAGTTEP